MKNPPFVVEYPVRLNDIAADAKMRSWVVFDYLQDAAGRHADELGLGLKQLKESDLSWVLSRIRLKMEDFPEYGDVLKITTYPSGFDRLFAYRQFVLTSALTGKFFGVAGSAWLTLNPGNFRPVSPAKHLTGLPQWEFEGETYFQGDSLARITPPGDLTDNTMTDERISTAMIDYNRHLNNAFYAMFTEDFLGCRTSSLVRMSELQINFNASTTFGDHLLCRGMLESSGGAFYVEGTQQSSGKNAFQAQGIWQAIELEDF